MKVFKSFLAVALIMMSAVSVSAQNIGDILGSVVEGVFTKSNLSLDDLVGDYKSDGPAVTFKSENLLQKAGGLAGASAIESKLKPYYEQYGLDNMTLNVDTDHNFSMKVKSMNLQGTITKNESDGTFDFNFNIKGIKLGKFTAYVEKSGTTLKVMFDATKLKSFISTVAKLTGNSMAKTLGTILDSYDGACIGWKMTSTSSASQSTTNSAVSTGINALKGILGGSK